MFLGLIETQGNQSYVFSSNREKAIRGASELLFRSTTDWVIDAVTGVSAHRSFEERAAFLRSQAPVGSGTTLVVATSGRAILLDPDRLRLEKVVGDLTTRALRDAPGLVVTGSVVPVHLEEPRGFDAAFHDARHRLGSNTTLLGPRNNRSLNLPFLQPCGETGLVASEFDRVKESWVSYQLLAQSEATTSSRSRLEALTEKSFVSSVDEIAGSDNWRAVVHADGNGIGRVFASLADLLVGDSAEARPSNLNHVEGYREFSLALEKATEESLLEAAQTLGEGKIMPILLGGDDIIVQVSAHRAIDFTCAYLSAFEKHSRSAIEVLRRFTPSAPVFPEYFTSCAGIVFRFLSCTT